MARPALEVADVFRDRGAAWRHANRGHVSLLQLKVMSAIENCRTAALGGHVARCEDGAEDAIRKAGSRFQKSAYSAGKSFTDEPDNVTKHATRLRIRFSALSRTAERTKADSSTHHPELKYVRAPFAPYEQEIRMNKFSKLAAASPDSKLASQRRTRSPTTVHFRRNSARRVRLLLMTGLLRFALSRFRARKKARKRGTVLFFAGPARFIPAVTCRGES